MESSARKQIFKKMSRIVENEKFNESNKRKKCLKALQIQSLRHNKQGQGWKTMWRKYVLIKIIEKITRPHYVRTLDMIKRSILSEDKKKELSKKKPNRKSFQ